MISSLELAKLCGISQGTVDRALHNRPGISAETRAKVLAMAEKHGYRPNPAVRELLTGDRRSVGAIVPAMNSPFFMDLMNTIRAAIAPDGFRFLLTPFSDEADFYAILNDFAARRARMVVAVPPRAPLKIPPKLTAEMPVVLLITQGQNTGGAVHARKSLKGSNAGGLHPLIPDERETGRVAARYLIQKGHTRLLHLSYSNRTAPVLDRAEGFMEECRRQGREALTLNGPEMPEALRTIRDRRISACFCHNDWLALTLMRALSVAGMRVPAEVSVLGVDDSPTFISLCPEITTLHYPAEEIAACVRARLLGEPIPPIAPMRVVERSTVREWAE